MKNLGDWMVLFNGYLEANLPSLWSLKPIYWFVFTGFVAYVGLVAITSKYR
jgi:hypothetical protein